MRTAAVTIVIRQTLDWERATYDQLIDPFAQAMARAWNETFRLSYFATRARIKTIAMQAHADVRETRVVEMADDILPAAAAPGDVLLFCDDDDWYHPQLVEHIRMAEPLRTGLLLWPDGIHGYHAGAFHLDRVTVRPLDDRRAVSGPIKTNNYAITQALAKATPQMLSHASAVRYVRTSRPTYQTLSRPLSLVNRHPCSYTVWRNTLNGLATSGVPSVLRALVTRYLQLKSPLVQPAFRWAQIHLDQVREVFQEVLK